MSEKEMKKNTLNQDDSVNENIVEPSNIEVKAEKPIAANEKTAVDMTAESSEGNHEKRAKGNKISFVNTLEAVVIDQVIIGAAAYVLLLLFDLIIRFGLGYFVSNMVTMYLVFYVVVSILYPAIIQNTKFENTIGRRFAGLKVVKAANHEETSKVENNN